MKQNRTIIYKVILLLTILMIGCTNLDEEVYDTIPYEDFGVNSKQINAIIAPIYSTLQSYFPAGGPWRYSELSSGMMLVPTRKGGDFWGGGFYKQITMHKYTPNTRSPYNACVNAVTTCNQIYYTIENSDAYFPNKEQVLGEIRGIRAFWYYILLDNFGNVPIVTDFDDLSKPSTRSRKEVYEFVMSELNDIKDVVREDVTGSSYGKVTRGVVYTLLAKMYLNAMVWNPEGGPKWRECVDACDIVLGLDYVLEPNWKINFQVHNEESKEIILPAIFTESDGKNRLAKFTLHYLGGIALGLKLSPYNGYSAGPSLIKSFDPEDKRKAWSFLTGPQINPETGKVLITAHGRPLIYTEEITKKYSIDADGWGQVEQEDGARCFKWEFESGLVGAMENDFAILRLADIYLMKAEALVRMNIDNAEATRLVNEIRKRAFDSSSKLYNSVTLNEIYNERRFEFAWEGLGRQDEIRFGTFLDEIPDWRPASNNTNLLLFPIPQSALDANPNLVQNPGY